MRIEHGAHNRFGNGHGHDLVGRRRQLGGRYRARLRARRELNVYGQLVARDYLGQRKDALMVKVRAIVLVRLYFNGEFDVEVGGQQKLRALLVDQYEAAALVHVVQRVRIEFDGSQLRVSFEHDALPFGFAAELVRELIDGRFDQKVNRARQIETIELGGALKIPVLFLDARTERAYLALGPVPVGYEADVVVVRVARVAEQNVAIVDGLEKKKLVLSHVGQIGANDARQLWHLERLDQLQQSHWLVSPLQFN